MTGSRCGWGNAASSWSQQRMAAALMGAASVCTASALLRNVTASLRTASGWR